MELMLNADLGDVAASALGVAAGAAAVMTPGTELCRREDVERLFSGMLVNARGGRRGWQG